MNQSESATEIIHIQWDGPVTVPEAQKLSGDKDYGLYQVYGGHPIYGTNVLLYLGRAREQTFGRRISQHRWWLDFNQDARRVCVYVGRLAGYNATPIDEVWNQQIEHAERLLILACRPAYNSQQALGALDVPLQNVHVLNWGSFCDLLPEVSGERWSSKWSSAEGYREFTTSDPLA